MYLLIIFWLAGSSGTSIAIYESYSDEATCMRKLTDALNIEVRKAIERQDIELPFMRCVKV